MAHPHHKPELTPAARRIVGALLLSIGLHAALVGLIGATGSASHLALQAQLTVAPLQAHLTVTTDVTRPVITAKSQDKRLRKSLPMTLPEKKAALLTPLPATVIPTAVAPPLPPSAAPLPVLSTPPLADDNFYSARELDVLPRPLAPIMPEFPQHIDANIKEGWVLLSLKLDDTGHVQSIEVEQTQPPGVFDDSALAAFRHAQFHPAEKDGRPVNAKIEIKVWFR